MIFSFSFFPSSSSSFFVFVAVTAKGPSLFNFDFLEGEAGGVFFFFGDAATVKVESSSLREAVDAAPYARCAVRARAALYYSHDWVASVLSLAGVDAPAAGAPVLYAHAVGGRAQDACATRAWRHEKRSAETAARWLRARGRAAAADRARAACYAARRPSRDYQNR